MQYTEVFKVVKNELFQWKFLDIFLIFAQNIDCGYTLKAVLRSTHNLCFGAKIRKIGIPMQTPFFYIKVGLKGVSFSRTCFPDDSKHDYRMFVKIAKKCSTCV